MADDPTTPLLEAAVALHTLFDNLLAAGFTEPQALRMLGVAVATMMGGADA